MSLSTLKTQLTRSLSNIPGWSTKRKIVAIASDDWGTIRMPSKQARQRLLKAGVDVDDNRFNRYDNLESNEDLEMLFEVLSKHRDKSGRSPVVTALCNVANPDFDRIRTDGFEQYHWEPVITTLQRYPDRDRVPALYREGIEAGIFVPEYHGREHLHVGRWMRGLKARDRDLLTSFENRALGPGPAGVGAAFDQDSTAGRAEQHGIAHEGLELFARQFGRRAQFFTAPSLIHGEDLEHSLSTAVPFIDVGKRHRYPTGQGGYRSRFRYMGQRSPYGQVYLTRNAIFEQNLPGISDPVGRCLSDMDGAFRWRKPAIISTHRVSVAGGISPKNRAVGLNALDTLLGEILQKWPDVEFLSVGELGEVITRS